MVDVLYYRFISTPIISYCPSLNLEEQKDKEESFPRMSKPLSWRVHWALTFLTCSAKMSHHTGTTTTTVLFNWTQLITWCHHTQNQRSQTVWPLKAWNSICQTTSGWKGLPDQLPKPHTYTHTHTHSACLLREHRWSPQDVHRRWRSLTREHKTCYRTCYMINNTGMQNYSKHFNTTISYLWKTGF